MSQHLRPSDYKIGDRLAFFDAIANHRMEGKIVEMDRNPEWEGSSGLWSGVRFWILVDMEDGGAVEPYRQQLHTGILAETDNYWFAGDPEAEATPEERGCYTIGRKL